MADEVNMDEVLSQAAQGPRRADSDGVSAESHPLKDLIALDKHQTAKSVRSNPAAATNPQRPADRKPLSTHKKNARSHLLTTSVQKRAKGFRLTGACSVKPSGRPARGNPRGFESPCSIDG